MTLNFNFKENVSMKNRINLSIYPKKLKKTTPPLLEFFYLKKSQGTYSLK